MNEFETYTRQFAAGFKAYLRTPADAEAKVILGPGGKELFFQTREQALDSLNKHLVRYVNGHLFRYGVIAGTEMTVADNVFKDIVKQKGKTRVISVTYKGRVNRCAKKR